MEHTVLSMNMDQFGIELELAVLLILQLIGSTVFAIFEIETSKWRLIIRWLIVAGATLGLYTWVGHWSLVFPIFTSALGGIVHTRWCKQNNIHPLNATPRKQYYELRGWEWKE